MATAGHQVPLRLARLMAPCALFLALLAVVPDHVTTAAAQPVGDALAIVETDPVGHTGDAADDPAIWVHPSDPSRSVVIGNDKGGSLEVYDLSGRRIQRINEGLLRQRRREARLHHGQRHTRHRGCQPSGNPRVHDRSDDASTVEHHRLDHRQHRHGDPG